VTKLLPNILGVSVDISTDRCRVIYMDINWTASGNTAYTTHGWMISKSADGFLVFDADSNYVGKFPTRDQAEEATQ
jgi:hypothetical protein